MTSVLLMPSLLITSYRPDTLRVALTPAVSIPWLHTEVWLPLCILCRLSLREPTEGTRPLRVAPFTTGSMVLPAIERQGWMGVRDGMNKRIWDGPDFHILTPTKTEKIPVCICNWTSSGDRTQPIHNLTLLQRKMQEKREFWRTFYGIYANSY